MKMPLHRSQMDIEKSSYMESIRSDASVLCQNQFIASTDRRVKSGKAQSLAKLLNRTHEQNLQQRRQRLRNILSTEATLHQQELINDRKTKTEAAFASRENRLFGLKAERERQRQKYVEEMRVQQLINNCDEIRPYLRQQLQDEYKSCQQLQIEDNHLKKMEEIDQDRLWHDIQTQVFNQMTQRELEESVVAQNRNLRDEQILRKQILEKTEFTKKDEHEADTMHCGKVFGYEPSEEEIFRQNKTKQLRFARDLLSQQEDKELAKRNLKNSEISHELESIDISTREIRMAEQKASETKKQNMKETLHFLGYAKNVAKEKYLAEREKDSLTETMQKDENQRYLKNRNYFDQQRNEFYKSIYAERWKQIIDRKEKLRQEKHEKINEIIAANEMFANNACIETELLRKKRNFRLQYGSELRAQWNYAKLEKDKKAASSQQLAETINKDEAHNNELIKRNVGRMHDIYPVHPNYLAILKSKN